MIRMLGSQQTLGKVRKNSVESLASEDSSICLSASSNSTYTESADAEFATQEIKINNKIHKDKDKKKSPKESEENDPMSRMKSESAFSSAFKKFSQMLSTPTNNQCSSKNTITKITTNYKFYRSQSTQTDAADSTQIPTEDSSPPPIISDPALLPPPSPPCAYFYPSVW